MTDPWIEPPIMAHVQIGRTSEQACTPPNPGMPWKGVTITTPVRLRERPNAPVEVPVCGRYFVSVGALRRPIGIVHLRVSGAPPIEPQAIGLGDPRNEAPAALPMQSGSTPETDYVGGAFAVDLALFIPFPTHPALIDVAIEFGGHMSEPHRFEWVPLPPRAPAP